MLFALQTAVSQAPMNWSQDTFLIKIHSSSRCYVLYSLILGVILLQINLSSGARICGAACQILYTMQNRAFLRTGLFYTTGQFSPFQEE